MISLAKVKSIIRKTKEKTEHNNSSKKTIQCTVCNNHVLESKIKERLDPLAFCFEQGQSSVLICDDCYMLESDFQVEELKSLSNSQTNFSTPNTYDLLSQVRLDKINLDLAKKCTDRAISIEKKSEEQLVSELNCGDENIEEKALTELYRRQIRKIPISHETKNAMHLYKRDDRNKEICATAYIDAFNKVKKCEKCNYPLSELEDSDYQLDPLDLLNNVKKEIKFCDYCYKKVLHEATMMIS